MGGCGRYFLQFSPWLIGDMMCYAAVLDGGRWLIWVRRLYGISNDESMRNDLKRQLTVENRAKNQQKPESLAI